MTELAINKIPHCKNMLEVRRGVDALDDVLVPLLVQRGGFMTQAARVKNDESLIRDEARIEAVVAHVRHIAQNEGGNPDLIENLYRAMMEVYIEYEFGELSCLRRPDAAPT